MNHPTDHPEPANILLIDDMPNNLRLLSSLLTKQGYKVRSVINGAMGLKAAQAKPPDLILLDINMPDLNGYEVCTKLKAHEVTQEIPVIFLSALDDVLDKVKAFRVGGSDYITKPFQIEEVIVRVQNQLQLRKAQQMLAEQNVVLEQEICDRKKIQSSLEDREMQLKQQTERLEAALTKIQNTQLQLIQSEKMASLGQLVAGIAHEINNPISFIYGNVHYVNDYLDNLVSTIKMYQKSYPNPTENIKDFTEDIDLDFVIDDLKSMMDSMKTGVERIHAIVLGLRTFSRLDEADIKSVDLHEGIESTLLMVQHRLQETDRHPPIQVFKHYGELPSVTCYSGQIHQVFLHLIENAIDAIEDKSFDPSFSEDFIPTIEIHTESTDDHQVIVCFQDNGVGIIDDIKNQIFNPFFTTKSVGQGSGLGLSICYQIIVEQHQGQLTYSALPEGGSQFTIQIPVHRKDES
ncbi:MAG: response regulator [Roseofilum sp. SID2]|uniref:hybrid sensor histidine kinase/response regulator n=1 Tax=unclassified Roseofilum TaxID=2620099 RepID=UPI001B1F0843|nr:MULTISPECIES: response regulator [unclassified Roseofilum]MBP0014733.1 response regulator [Roseofilum sp. SID3]MBP0025596.1 response regulator [Roseofilum sp. SID2]